MVILAVGFFLLFKPASADALLRYIYVYMHRRLGISCKQDSGASAAPAAVAAGVSAAAGARL